MGRQWVLLAAGSKGWNSYRHQANVCHAFKMVQSNKIPVGQVVVMMYDDIANDEENPHREKIIEPDGRNVYTSVPKHYTRQDVTADNFLAVLRGDKEAVKIQARRQRKVLESDENDTIFVFLSGHGGAGIFAFPADDLYAFDLIETINEMVSKRQFSQMVIYMESCNSGSMIEHLPTAQVYGVSASGPHENHYACFHDAGRLTFLSCEFTSWWLLHSKMSNLTRTTFQAQFQFLREKMEGSTPRQYGNTALSRLSISEFLGCPGPGTQRKYTRRAQTFRVTDLTPSDDVPEKIQEDRIQREWNPERRTALQQDYDKIRERRERIEGDVRDIALRASPDEGERALTEIRTVHRLRDVKDVAEHYRQTFRRKHGDQHHHIVLSHMQVFVTLCEYGVDVERIKEAITQILRDNDDGNNDDDGDDGDDDGGDDGDDDGNNDGNDNNDVMMKTGMMMFVVVIIIVAVIIEHFAF